LPSQRRRGAIPQLSQYVFMAWCFVKHRDKFTFYTARNVMNKSVDSVTLHFSNA